MLLFATIKISKFKEYIRYVKGFSLIHLLKKPARCTEMMTLGDGYMEVHCDSVSFICVKIL